MIENVRHRGCFTGIVFVIIIIRRRRHQPKIERQPTRNFRKTNAYFNELLRVFFFFFTLVLLVFASIGLLFVFARFGFSMPLLLLLLLFSDVLCREIYISIKPKDNAEFALMMLNAISMHRKTANIAYTVTIIHDTQLRFFCCCCFFFWL